MMEEFLLAKAKEVLGGLQISQVVNLALRLFHIRLAVASWDSQDTPTVRGHARAIFKAVVLQIYP